MSDGVVLAALARLQQSIERIQGDIVGMQGDIVGMKGDIVGMKGDIVGMKGDIAALQASQQTLGADLTARMDRLEASQLQYRTDMMDRIDRLQNTLTTHQESGIVTLGAGERAERIAKAASDEVRLMSEQFSTLTRLVLTLQHSVDGLRRDHP